MAEDDAVAARKAQARDFEKTLSEPIMLGGTAAGGLNSFPASDLARRTIERDALEQALDEYLMGDEGDQGDDLDSVLAKLEASEAD